MSTGKPKGRAWLVSHTHWDREWYLSVGRFRVDLARVVGEVLDALDKGEMEHFVLDGQAIALRDHLEFRPEDRRRVLDHVRGGRLSIGPWYILPDEFLVSGEATLRNLLAGRQICDSLGGRADVGYMPDSFGHLAQVPQLLRGAGLDSFVYTRGNDDASRAMGSEYRWQAPDGSEVLAICQEEGYCNAAGLGVPEIWEAHTPRRVDTELAVEKIGALLGKLSERGRAGVWLLNNGCDHFPPQRDFGRVLAALREAFPQVEFRSGSHRQFLADLQAQGAELPLHRGELLGGVTHHILSGVWSARMYIKQANEELQTLLEQRLEPLSAMAHFLHGLPAPRGVLRWAWRRLMENHPHDSICGCSTDRVHREMMARFSEVQEACEQQLHRILRDLQPFFAPAHADDTHTRLAVTNSLPWRRDEVVTRMVILLPGQPHIDRMRLEDEAGKAVPFELVERHWQERFWGIDYRAELHTEEQLKLRDTYLHAMGERIRRSGDPEDKADQFCLIRFRATDLPGLGHKGYRLLPAGEGDSSCRERIGTARAEGRVLENGYLRVTLHGNGSFDLLDKQGGKEYQDLHLLEQQEDVGDEYDYSPAAEGFCGTSDGLEGQVEVLDAGGLEARLEARFHWPVPKRIGKDRKTRSEELVELPVRVRLSLRDGDPLLRVETTLDNRAEDIRYRALFRTDLPCTTIHSEGQFMVHARPLRTPASEHWEQPHPGTLPQQGYSFLHQEGRGLAVYNRGLPEIAPLDEGQGAGMALTLLRAVGWLSRDDFPTRRNCNAGPTLPTPEAQCAGEHTFRYALQCLQGDSPVVEAARCSMAYRAPLQLRQGVCAGAAAGAGLLELEGAGVLPSALKVHEERDSLVIRLWNTGSAVAPVRLRFGRPLAKAWITNLIEERQEELSLTAKDSIELRFGSHKVLGLEVVFASSEAV